jgi:COP9 signalosome complex subunit 7
MFHQEKILHVDWVAGRDVTPEELARTAGVLDSWYAFLPSFPFCVRSRTCTELCRGKRLTTRCNNAQNLLSALDERISQVRAESYAYAEADTAYRALRETEYAALVSAASDKKAGRQTRGGAGHVGGDGYGRGEVNERGQGRRSGDIGDSFGEGGMGAASGRKSGRRSGGGGGGAPADAASGHGPSGSDKSAGLMGRLWVRFLLLSLAWRQFADASE